MKKFSNLKLSLINIFIIILLIGILFLTFQFFINKQKIEGFKNDEECPKGDCLECEGDGNNDNDNSKMTPYGYRKNKDAKPSKGTCTNTDDKKQEGKCKATNDDVSCGEIKKPIVNRNLCEMPSDEDEPEPNDDDQEYQQVDMDKYILKSKLKTLNLEEKTKYLKSQIKIQSPTSSTTSTTTTEPTSTTDEPEQEEEEVTNTPIAEPEPTTTTMKNEEEGDGSSKTPDKNNKNNKDNDNLICDDQLRQITKELKDIKDAMFQRNNTKQNNNINVRENKKDKDFNLLDDTHPFYNCYDKNKNPYSQFKQYTKEDLEKGKKRKKFMDTPYKLFF